MSEEQNQSDLMSIKARVGRPKSILFACNMNSVRSPMAETLAKDFCGPTAIIHSAGVYEGGLDPFLETILAEQGLSCADHEPQDFQAIDPLDYQLVIALTPKAAEEALKYFAADQIEFWDVPNPTDVRGSRDQLMEAYREARDILKKRINERFS